MSFYKTGSNLYEELANHLDKDMIFESLSKLAKSSDKEEIMEYVKVKLQYKTGLNVLAEKFHLSPESLIVSLTRLFPELFTHKFCTFLKNNYFDVRCATCQSYMPKKKKCKNKESLKRIKVDLSATDKCDKWEKKCSK